MFCSQHSGIVYWYRMWSTASTEYHHGHWHLMNWAIAEWQKGVATCWRIGRGINCLQFHRVLRKNWPNTGFFHKRLNCYLLPIHKILTIKLDLFINWTQIIPSDGKTTDFYCSRPNLKLKSLICNLPFMPLLFTPFHTGTYPFTVDVLFVKKMWIRPRNGCMRDG